MLHLIFPKYSMKYSQNWKKETTSITRIEQTKLMEWELKLISYLHFWKYDKYR